MQTTTATASTPVDRNFAGTATAGAGKSTLGADDFMKLLGTQLTSQDPLEPMKDTEFISQMASFTSLEQMRTLSKSFDDFSASQTLASAPTYVGKQVTVSDPSAKGGSVTGIVETVVMKDGQPTLMIGGTAYDLKAITSIGAPLPAPPASDSNSASESDPSSSTSKSTKPKS